MRLDVKVFKTQCKQSKFVFIRRKEKKERDGAEKKG